MRTALLAEREGFEPPVLAYSGFQDRPLRPLGHLSRAGIVAYYVNGIESLSCRQLFNCSLRRNLILQLIFRQGSHLVIIHQVWFWKFRCWPAIVFFDPGNTDEALI